MTSTLISQTVRRLHALLKVRGSSVELLATTTSTVNQSDGLSKGSVARETPRRDSVAAQTDSIRNHRRLTRAELMTMTVAHDVSRRSTATPQGTGGLALEDRFEVLKEIGDGSFGSVVLARVRSAGGNVARRGTVVGVVEIGQM